MDNQYKLVEHPGSDFYAIHLTDESPYQDVRVIYGTVKVIESVEIDSATLSFTYNINDPGEFDDSKLTKDPDFNNYLGDLLTHIISEGTIGNIKSTTDAHTESSSQ